MVSSAFIPDESAYAHQTYPREGLTCCSTFKYAGTRDMQDTYASASPAECAQPLPHHAAYTRAFALKKSVMAKMLSSSSVQRGCACSGVNTSSRCSSA